MKTIHRYFSFFLCLALILFCLSAPLRTTASASATIAIGIGGTVIQVAPYIAVVAIVLVAVGLAASGSVEELVDQATEFYNSCSPTLRQWFDDVAEDVIDGTSVFRIPSKVQTELKEELDDKVPDNIPYMFIPGTLTDLASLTGSDVFIQDVVGAIEAGNSLTESTNTLLRTTYGLLNTGFAEIGDSFDSLLSGLKSTIGSMNSNLANKLTTLNTSVGSLSDSIDFLESSLSGDLVDLKTLYSTFGNETLSRLDTLNESIQAIDSSSLSTDFVNLYELIAQNDSLIKKSVEALPGQISDSIASFYETQSLQLEDISNKLGTFEESFLETMTGDLQLIRDEVSAGFGDVTTALDNLEVIADIDLQPVIDQLFNTEVSLVGSLDSLYSLINENFVDISIANNELLSSMEMVLTESFTEFFTNYDINIWDILTELQDLNSSTLQTEFGSLTASIEDTISSLDLSLSEGLDILELNLGDLWSLTNTKVVGTLTDIKTSLQTIAGTTTADPGTGGDDSQDDANNQKIPLIPHINNGFEQGENYIGSVYTFLDDELEAFRVAALIFEEFANVPFFYKLIITSCSIGLIATLLGMALNVQSYSVSQRRREEAAQVKASNRMQRSVAA